MDYILQGILASSHQDDVKLQLIGKICDNGSCNPRDSDVCCVLTLAMDWVLNGTSALQVASGFKLMGCWAANNVPVMNSLLTQGTFKSVLVKPCLNQVNLPLLLTEILRLQRDSSCRTSSDFHQNLMLIAIKCPNIVNNAISDVHAVRNLIQLFVDFQSSLPTSDINPQLSLYLLRSLASYQIPSDEQYLKGFIRDVISISEFLHHLWQHLTPASLLLDSLRELFSILMTVDGKAPLVCLGSLVRFIPVQIAGEAIKTIVHDCHIVDECLKAVLCHMIDWLAWPAASDLDKWVITFFHELTATKKLHTLVAVIEAKAEQVLLKMQFPCVCEASFKIFSYMLLSYRHSPNLFHQVLQSVPGVWTRLQDASDGRQVWCRSQMAALLRCLMRRHAGFPDLYSPILDIIEDEPFLSLDGIKAHETERLLSAGDVTASRNLPSSVLPVHVWSGTGKTGLCNHGNTCYMNSAIQALFACDRFRVKLLARRPQPREKVMVRLQRIFAYLLRSKRPAVDVTELLAALRPPWLRPGHQQDCSEFLKFLLDQLSEQETDACRLSRSAVASAGESQGRNACCGEGAGGVYDAHPTPPHSAKEVTLAQDLFGGKLETLCRCLSCGHESSRVDSFTDIPLGFPSPVTGSVTDLPPARVGGGTDVGQRTIVPTSAMTGCDCSGRRVKLGQLLEAFLSVEQLNGDNQYRCDRCLMLRSGERVVSIVRAPPYMVFTILRFWYDQTRLTGHKLLTDVQIPRTLAVPVATDGQTEQCRERRSKLLNHSSQKLSSSAQGSPENWHLYGLCSIIVHSGTSLDSGHYYSYSRHSRMVGDVQSAIDSMNGSERTSDSQQSDGVKNGIQNLDIDLLDDEWYLFNDASVSKTSYASFSQLSQRFPEDVPYVLLYCKLTLDSTDTDSGETLLSNHVISSSLGNAIDTDNFQYMKEQELASSKASAAQSTTPCSASSNLLDNWHDYDDHDPPPDTFGAGGMLGDINNGNRFVF